MKSLAASLVAMMFAVTAMAIETPNYKTVEQDGKFEVRDYPAMSVARTAMGDGDFMRLFRYISGSNESEQKIAMTAPVLVQHQGEDKGMSFVVPREVAATKVPAPKADDVSVEQMPAARFAVFTYSGRRTDKNEGEALSKLRAWMEKKNLRPEGEPVFAYYDPPWTLPFMRRNEVMLRVSRTQP
jgi:predicted transcriptional regulator YdeE